MPYEDSEGEEAFNLAARQIAPKKATPKRGRGATSPSARGGRGAGNLSGGRGSGVGAHVEDNGGSEGKSIPIDVPAAVKPGEAETSYLVHYRGHPKKKPPTKYDNSVTLEYQNYEGTTFLVRTAREENPYLLPKLAAIDRRFWSVFHFNFYSTVLLSKNKIRKMQWIDW